MKAPPKALRCVVCGRLSSGKVEGWIRVKIGAKEVATGRERVRICEDYCPEHATEAVGAMKGTGGSNG